MFASGGVGAVVGKKAVELGVKKSLAKNVERRFKKYGYSFFLPQETISRVWSIFWSAVGRFEGLA
jgi:hypothetical protein